MSDIDALLNIMARLRDPQRGCDWDLRQDFRSIAPYTVEEAYEVSDAIAAGDMTALKDELGDLLLQVAFHAQMASEQNAFTFADVVEAISAKMIRRHPHVFAGKRYRSDAEQAADWERIKRQERAARGERDGGGVLDGVAAGLPAFSRALKLQRKAAEVGFDWDDAGPVLDKMSEELDELRAAVATLRAADADADADARAQVAGELGDLLFVCVNLARHLALDPDLCLRLTNHKFERRFRYIEQRLREQQRAPEDATLDELEQLWQQAKKKGVSKETPEAEDLTRRD